MVKNSNDPSALATTYIAHGGAVEPMILDQSTLTEIGFRVIAPSPDKITETRERDHYKYV